MHDSWYDHLVGKLLHHMCLLQICRLCERLDGGGRCGGLVSTESGWGRRSSLSSAGSVSTQTYTSIHGKKF